MRDLFIIGGLLFLFYELTAPPAATVPTLNILAAGPNVPLQGVTHAQIQLWLSRDEILPDEADAMQAAIEGLPADRNALANGLAKVNAWLQAEGAA